MTNDCKQKVETMLINGNTHDFIIAQKILKFEELSHKIKNIIDFSKMVEKPLSTTSRFINKLGYKSFKHFIFEFNGYDGNEIKKDKELNTFWSYGLQKIDEISKKIRGKIFVMSSKKTKSIAFYLYYSFQHIKVNCEFFDGKISELEYWLNQIGPNDTLIMISMSGTSNRFTSALN
ncbi:MAG: hypothetical protein E7Y34_02360, partial [Mycoplasma sp.]|nr:hypothetical protein [Mycoplasma sp.]